MLLFILLFLLMFMHELFLLALELLALEVRSTRKLKLLAVNDLSLSVSSLTKNLGVLYARLNMQSFFKL